MKVERIAGAVSSISERDSDLTHPGDTPASVVLAFIPPSDSRNSRRGAQRARPMTVTDS